jgi:hypothetical protein
MSVVEVTKKGGTAISHFRWATFDERAMEQRILASSAAQVQRPLDPPGARIGKESEKNPRWPVLNRKVMMIPHKFQSQRECRQAKPVAPGSGQGAVRNRSQETTEDLEGDLEALLHDKCARLSCEYLLRYLKLSPGENDPDQSVDEMKV